MLWLPAPNIVMNLNAFGMAANDSRHVSPWVPLKGRPEPEVGDLVRVYRNLNNGQYSVVALAGPLKGLVCGYAPAIGIKDIALWVSKKTREAVVTKGVRTVHAWVEGTYTGCSDQPPHTHSSNDRRVTYMPFIKDYFFFRLAPQKALTTLTSAWAYEADLWVSETPLA